MRSGAALSAACFLATLLSGQAHALNRCVSADGSVSFSDMPCPAQHSGGKIVVRPASGSASATDHQRSGSSAPGTTSDRAAAMQKYIDVA